MSGLLISLGPGVIYLAELNRWGLIQLDLGCFLVPKFAKCRESV